MKILEAQGIIDEAAELKRQYIIKSGNAVMRSVSAAYSSNRNKANANEMIDKLLKRFSTEEKYEIMKSAFIHML